MKIKFASLVMLAMFVAGGVSAQVQEKKAAEKPKRPRMTEEQMIQKQTERMSAALLLDDETAAKFGPVYQQYLKEMGDIRKETRKNAQADKEQMKKNEKVAPTDAEIEARMENRFASCRKMLDTREKYYKEFKKILTAKQIEKIYNQSFHAGKRFQKFGNKQAPARQKLRCPMGNQQKNCPLKK